MTQKRTLLLRGRNQEYVCELYTSRFEPGLGATYVTSIHCNGAVAHRGGDSLAQADERGREFIREVAQIVGEGRVERSRVRACRIQGLIQLVHGDRAVPLDEAEATRLAGMNGAQARAEIGRTIMPLLPAYEPLLAKWLADETIDWRALPVDLAQIVAHPNDDYDAV